MAKKPVRSVQGQETSAYKGPETLYRNGKLSVAEVEELRKR